MCITVVCEFRTNFRKRKLKEIRSLNVITRCKLKNNNIKSDVKETGSGYAGWNKLPQDRDRRCALVRTAKKHQVSY
jgi:hypothetical protein